MGVHADKWGPLGSIVTGLCCLGFAPVLGALSAAGLGFLLYDAILIPLLALFLTVTVFSLRRDRRRHGRATPERLSWVAAVGTVVGLWISAVATALGLALLVLASAWNAWLVWRQRAGRLKGEEG